MNPQQFINKLNQNNAFARNVVATLAGQFSVPARAIKDVKQAMAIPGGAVVPMVVDAVLVPVYPGPLSWQHVSSSVEEHTTIVNRETRFSFTATRDHVRVHVARNGG